MTGIPLPDGIVLRPAAPADLEAVRALIRDAKLPLDGLEDQFSDAYAVAVRREGRIVGVAGMEVHGDCGLLRSAVVAPPLRGLGLGEALTKDRLAWARGQDLRAVWLLTTTAADFFDRFGFVKADRASAPPAVQASKEFTVACPASAACLRLELEDA
jgi:amino-acid N-acetyltransferase